MYITEMDKLNFILAQGRRSALSLEDILREYINEWLHSPKRALMLKSADYYNNNNDIIYRKRQSIGEDGKLVHDDKLTNSRLNHAFLRKLTDQKAQYLFGLPMAIQGKNAAYVAILNAYFDKAMLKKLKNICKEAVNKGIAWLQVYIDETGELKFKKIPSEQIIPIWVDDDKETLAAVLRVYEVEVYEGSRKRTVTKAEYWTDEGVIYYTLENGRLLLDVEKESGAHFNRVQRDRGQQENKSRQGMNWTKVPFIVFRYNEEEQPLLKFVKALIDDYDLLSSDDSNNILDSPNAVIVLKGYDGENLGEFRRNLATYKAIKIDGDAENHGGVETLAVPINTAEVKTHLEQVRKDLYEIGRGVDTQTTNLGNATGVALKFVYADLDLDCSGLETEFQSAFLLMRFFIDTYLQLTGQGDFFGEAVDFILNRDIIINETEAITNCKNSTGIISEQTIVANHPFVKDVDAELALVQKEREASQRQPDDYDADFGQTAPKETLANDDESGK